MALKLSKKNTKVKKIIKKARAANNSALNAVTQSDKNENLNYPTGEYIESVGRRKVATARVRLYESKGDMIVNDMLIKDYFSDIRISQVKYLKPFEITGTKDKFSMTVQVSGSGLSAQLDAIILGISRALVEFDASFKPLLKREGLLTRDDRMKETRKIGTGGKARRKRQSPKR